MTQTAIELDLSTFEDIAPQCDAHMHLLVRGRHDPHYVEPPCTEEARWIVTKHEMRDCQVRPRFHCDRHKDFAITEEESVCLFCGSRRIIGIEPL